MTVEIFAVTEFGAPIKVKDSIVKLSAEDKNFKEKFKVSVEKVKALTGNWDWNMHPFDFDIFRTVREMKLN